MPGKRPKCGTCGKIHAWRPASEPDVCGREAGDVKRFKEKQLLKYGVHPDDKRRPRERGMERIRMMQLERQAFPMETPRPLPMNPRLLTDGQLLQLVKDLERADRYDWRANARPEQLEPADYRNWLLMGGRGMGKTRTGAETVRDWTGRQKMRRIAVIAKGSRELRDVCYEGVSGLLSVIPPEEILNYRKGLGDTYIDLKNGAKIIGYSAEAPDAIRGQAFDAIWGDEFAAWPKHLGQDMFDQAWFCMRESDNPRMILTTTPKRVQHLMDFLERAEKPNSHIVITKGKTSDNTALKQAALEELYERYAGTHLGRQELDGELLGDVEGALWVPEMVEHARWEPAVTEDLPPFRKVIIGVDPSGSATGDATGIVAIGYTADRRIFVLGCYSTKGLPATRYEAVCRAAERHRDQGARCEIVVEYNFGGDNAIFAIDQQWKSMVNAGQIDGKCPILKKSTLRGDKAVKASPVAALYEQQMNTGVQRILHLNPTRGNGLDKLENEQLSWAVTDKQSPNSMDALTIAARRAMQELGLERQAGTAARTRRLDDGYRPF